MMIASQIPSYAARLRCAGIMRSFEPDNEYTMIRLNIVDQAIAEVRNVLRAVQCLFGTGQFGPPLLPPV